METIREFNPGDRYQFDFKLCTSKKGYAQLDSYQDASYYGTWISPSKRQVVSYCEGDITINTAENDAELVQEVEKIEAWNASNADKRFSNGKSIGIDPGFNEDLKQAVVKAGLGEYLH